MTKFSRVDTWLANVVSTTSRRGNLIFALDATASRERTYCGRGVCVRLRLPQSRNIHAVYLPYKLVFARQ